MESKHVVRCASLSGGCGGARLTLGARCSGDGCRRVTAHGAQCHVGETCRPPSTYSSFVGRLGVWASGRLLNKQRRIDERVLGSWGGVLRTAEMRKGANIHTSTRVVSAPGGATYQRSSCSPYIYRLCEPSQLHLSLSLLSVAVAVAAILPPVPCLAHQHDLARISLPKSISNLQSVSLNKLPIS